MSTPLQPQQQPQPTKAKKQIKKSLLSAVKSVFTPGNDLPYEIVSSFRLKRLKPKTSDQMIKLLIDPEDFKELQLLGIKYGVTYCEVLKGLLNQQLADVNGGSTLTHFIPVLNS